MLKVLKSTHRVDRDRLRAAIWRRRSPLLSLAYAWSPKTNPSLYKSLLRRTYAVEQFFRRSVPEKSLNGVGFRTKCVSSTPITAKRRNW